jgi:hypothetical protein
MEGRLQELCAKMYSEGYNYASFQDIKGGDILLETPIKEGAKPDKGLYFSKLKMFNKDMGLSDSSARARSRSSDQFVYPEWYQYVKNEDFSVDAYEKKGIIFAKIDESKLKNVKDMKPITASGFDRFSVVPLYNWGEVKECGIIVNDKRFIREKGWDIEQCVIWNADCLHDYKVFSNTGKRISYKEVKCEIKNMDVGEQLKKMADDFKNSIDQLKNSIPFFKF